MIKSKLIFELYNESMHTKSIDVFSTKVRDIDVSTIERFNISSPILCRMTIKQLLKKIAEDSVECIICFTPSYIPFGMIGLKKIDGEVNLYWSIINDEIDNYKKSFVKESHYFTSYFLDKYGEMFSFVNAETTNVIPWIERIGGSVDKENEIIDESGSTLYPVHFKKKGDD